MNKTLYIGAKCVPSFYIGSGGSSDWASGVPYEPLTVVTYNGSWYISKIAVPASTTAPAAGTYWAKVPGYLTELDASFIEWAQEHIGDLETDVSGLDTRLDAAEDDITELKDDLSYINDKTDYIATGSGEVKEHLTFHLGYVHGLPNYTPQNPGHNSYNDTICTTDYISTSEAKKIYFDSSEYKICVVYYDSDKTYQTFSSFSATSPAILNTNYAYCVPELRKIDESAFTDSDIIDADETAYYVPSITVDIVRHAELEPFVDSTKQKIQPDFIPNLPINVYRTISGYSCEVPEFTIDTSWVTVFVDSVYGNDSNNGTEDHPVKTITQADYLCRVAMNNGKKAVMQIADDSVFYIDDIPASYDAKKSYIIRAEHKATIFAGKKPTFTVDGNHYVSEALTSYNIIGCVNTSETDDYGLFKPMVPVESVNDVDETANSYYIDSTNKIVYVNPSTQISDIVVIFSNKYAMNPATYGFTESSFCMIENITFVGNSTATGRESSTVGETIKRTIYVKNCIFQHGFSNNCVSFNDFDYTYIVDCIAGYAKYDCFNYHFTRKPTPTDALVVEVNTCGKEGGYYSGISGTSNQISTCHDGANILRCNTHGYNSDGSLIADVNGCYSVCLDCTVINTSYIGAVGAVYAPYRFDNAVAQRNGKTLLQNCYGYDSRNDKLVSAVDLILNGINTGGSIIAESIRVEKKLI